MLNAQMKGVSVNVRSGFFSILIGVVLLSPTVLYGLVNICKVDVPSALTAQDASWLTGGIARAQVRENLSLDAFEEGRFQSSIEKAVGNYVPAKASVLLGNAAVQRMFISASNAIFEWECYPTYYGSTKLYLPSHFALAEMPMLDETKVISSGDLENGLMEFGASLAKVASRHPDKNFWVVLADRTSTSRANPAFDLVSNRLSTEDCGEIMQKQIEGCGNVSVTVRAYDNVTDYYRCFYPSDHHWNGFGALDAAERIGRLGVSGIAEEPSPSVSFGELFFNGTLSRRGLLCLNRTPIIEPAFNVENLVVGEESASYFKYMFDKNGREELERQGLRAEYNFYGEWYGGDRDVLISNTSETAKGKALLICDSYGDAFRWAIAGQYGELGCEMKLKQASYTAADLESWIAGNDSKDIYLVGWAGNFAHLKAK